MLKFTCCYSTKAKFCKKLAKFKTSRHKNRLTTDTSLDVVTKIVSTSTEVLLVFQNKHLVLNPLKSVSHPIDLFSFEFYSCVMKENIFYVFFYHSSPVHNFWTPCMSTSNIKLCISMNVNMLSKTLLSFDLLSFKFSVRRALLCIVKYKYFI